MYYVHLSTFHIREMDINKGKETWMNLNIFINNTVLLQPKFNNKAFKLLSCIVHTSLIPMNWATHFVIKFALRDDCVYEKHWKLFLQMHWFETTLVVFVWTVKHSVDENKTSVTILILNPRQEYKRKWGELNLENHLFLDTLTIEQRNFEKFYHVQFF